MNRGVRKIFVDYFGKGERNVSWLYVDIFVCESCIWWVNGIGI